MRSRDKARRRLGVALAGRGHSLEELGRGSLLELVLRHLLRLGLLLPLPEHLRLNLLKREAARLGHLLVLLLRLVLVALELGLDVVEGPYRALRERGRAEERVRVERCPG